MEYLPYYYSLLLTIIVFLFLKLKTSWQKPNVRLPPGPWKLPILGSAHHLGGSLLPHQAMRDLSKRYGPLMLLKLGQVPTIIVSSPEAAKEIMTTNDINFANRHSSFTLKALDPDRDSVIFAPYGDYWRQTRKALFIELLSSKRVQSFHSIREEEVTSFIRSISASSSQLVNLSEMLHALSNDITARAVIGNKCNEQKAFLCEVAKMVKLAGGFSVADLFPSWPLIGLFTGVTAKANNCRKNVFQILDSIIQDHRERNNATEDDFLDVLLRIQREDDLQNNFSDDAIKAIITDVMIAASESSATTIAWAMSELMRNEKIMQRAQSEVRRVLQGRATVNEAAISELNYLHLVIKETLRLHAVTPLLIPRQCRRASKVLGYDIPEGACVLVNAWAIGRDPKYWEDAEEFKPERFEKSTVDFKGSHFEFIPFGSGRRMCPGMSFGLAAIELTLVNLLYHFDWELPNVLKPHELDMTESAGIAAGRRSDLLLRAIPFVSLS